MCCRSSGTKSMIRKDNRSNGVRNNNQKKGAKGFGCYVENNNFFLLTERLSSRTPLKIIYIVSKSSTEKLN